MNGALFWIALPALAFVAIGGGVMTIASAVAACDVRATWPQTNRAALKAALYGAAAATAAYALVAIWQANHG